MSDLAISNLEDFRARARAWLADQAATFGKEARRGLAVEDDMALGRRYMAA